MTMQYNDPGTTPSTMGTQYRTDFYQKQALIEARKEQFFTQLADVTSMPKNMGKKIKRYHYIPLLDDANINDQGLDAAGATLATTERFVTFPQTILVVTNATKVAKTATINDNINSSTKTAATVAVAGADDSGGAGFANITVSALQVRYLNSTKSDAVVALNLGVTVLQGSGNLYGSSKDVGTISGKLPVLSETGGRVNRVGFKRKELEGTFEKFGFFDEYTQESLDFDTDAELEQHINREMLAGASEITEDALQIDLLNEAGVKKFCGGATTKATTVVTSLVSYGDLLRMSIDLDNNRTPKQTTMFTGTRMTDTRTIPGARALFCGSELIPTLKSMKDLHNEPAFIPVEKYASGGNTLTGEIGAIDQWRIIIVPEMMKWAGAGAAVGGDTTMYATNGRFDVFPMLAVGEGSFTTISFQTDGKGVKFKIYHKKPGEETADRNDPYGEKGFMSIKWYYGFMKLRSERLAVLHTVAKM